MAYRNDLQAAHYHIAQLEEEVKILKNKLSICRDQKIDQTFQGALEIENQHLKEQILKKRKNPIADIIFCCFIGTILLYFILYLFKE